MTFGPVNHQISDFVSEFTICKHVLSEQFYRIQTA